MNRGALMTTGRFANTMVFATSFCILVLEILAGRLLAPLIGVSLETFTGIIGTVLAGIALGSALGGRAADRHDPRNLIGPTLIGAGVLTWVAPLILSALGPVSGADPVTIVFLSAITFFAPAALLSAVTPMVIKLQIEDLDETGTIVGGLSAAGTAGALVGTFATGFVLVEAFGTRDIMVAIGALIVGGGLFLTGWTRIAANPLGLLLLGLIGVGATVADGPCDAETGYACIEVVADPNRPDGVSLLLNGSRNSYLDRADPQHLEFRYMRLFRDVVETRDDGPLDVLHLGGAGFAFPRALGVDRPGSRQTVLEIDGELVDFARRELDLVTSEELDVKVGDARLTVSELEADGFDVVVGDAFNGLTVPWHLTTTQFVSELDRVVRPDGVVVLNLIDGGDLAFVRAQLATYGETFEHLGLIVPPGGDRFDGARNVIVIASHQPLTVPSVAAEDGEFATPEAVLARLGDGLVLDDDFAPVDQLRTVR